MRLRIQTLALLVNLCPVTMLGQTDVEITAFEHTGRLSWTNTNTNSFYRVEWTPSLDSNQHWRTGYTGLMDVHSTQTVLTASVPVFFRIVAGNQLLIPDSTNIRSGTIVQGISGSFWEGQRYRFAGSTNLVTDNKTGLMWVRRKGLLPRTNWYTAVSNCTALVYEGYDDWRLPTIDELQTLTDPTRLHPMNSLRGDSDPFINNQDLGDLNMWSSTEGSPTTAAHMSFSSDTIHWNTKNDPATVWPVRSPLP